MNFCLHQKILFAQPNTIPGLQLWFASDSGIVKDSLSGKVKQWLDLSGNANYLLQTDTSLQPEIILNNSNIKTDSILRFNLKKLSSVNNINLSGNPAYSIFLVSKNKFITTNSGIFGWGDVSIPLSVCGMGDYLNTGNYRIVYSGGNDAIFTQMDTVYNILSILKSPGAINLSSQMFKNGIQLSSQPSSSPNIPNIINTPFTVGQLSNYLNERFVGEIAEIIVYNVVLTSTQRQQVEQYLSDKYAPPVNLGQDITVNYGFCPVKLNAHQDWFTSYQWNTGSTADSVSVNNNGSYSLYVTNIFGYISSDTINITYPGNFTPFPDTTICYGDTLIWNTNLNKTNYTFLWQDSSTDSLLSITQPGQYFVRVTDTLGCIRYSDTINVAVDNFPQIVSLGADTAVCAGVIITLAGGASQATSYLWSTGATASSIIISSSATYYVTAWDANGCSGSDTVNINVKSTNPSVNFSAPDVCFGALTFFTDLSIAFSPDSLFSWQWNFGDATGSTAQNPQHTYTASGTYTVSLFVTTDSGCSNSFQKPVYVRAIPTATFSASFACSGSNVSFTDASSASDTTIVSWFWDFGDSNFSSSQNPSHIYSSAGTYTVQLVVTSGFGCTDTVWKILNVLQSPVAAFTYTPACAGSPVIFSDSSVNPFQWLWEFGDASTSTSQNPSNVYSTGGIYTATLTVTDVNGCMDTSVQNITVYFLPAAGFVSDTACEMEPVLFTDTSSVQGSSLVQWQWTFGAMGSASQQNPSFVFPDSGNYNVQLIVTSQQGCKDTITEIIFVNPKPLASFLVSNSYGNPPLAVSFSNQSSGAVNYFWDFGDGVQSALQNPSHIFTGTDTFQVMLIATSTMGCRDTTMVEIFVWNPLLDIAVTNASAVQQGSIVKVIAGLANGGTQDITYAELSAYLENGNSFQEIWTGLLAPGTATTYSFTAAFELRSTNDVNYFCVEAKNPNLQTDEVPSNNKKCAALSSEVLLLNPFPNPSNGNISVFYIIPSGGTVEFSIYDTRGREVAKIQNNASKGLNLLEYNAASLTNGVYAIKMVYKGNAQVKIFVKE